MDAFETSVGYRSLLPALFPLEKEAPQQLSEEELFRYAKDSFDADLAEALRSTGEWHWKREIRDAIATIAEALSCSNQDRYESVRRFLLNYYAERYHRPSVQEYRTYLREKRTQRGSAQAPKTERKTVTQQNEALPFTTIQKKFGLSLLDLDTLWEELGNVPLNYDEDGKSLVAIEGVDGSDKEECIDIDFYIWKRGEEKHDIWHWFDDMYTGLGTCLGDRWFSEAGQEARKKERLEAEKKPFRVHWFHTGKFEADYTVLATSQEEADNYVAEHLLALDPENVIPLSDDYEQFL